MCATCLVQFILHTVKCKPRTSRTHVYILIFDISISIWIMYDEIYNKNVEVSRLEKEASSDTYEFLIVIKETFSWEFIQAGINVCNK